MNFLEALSKVLLEGSVAPKLIGTLGIIAGVVLLWGYASGANSIYLLRGLLLLGAGLVLIFSNKFSQRIRAGAFATVGILVFLPV